jgi:hypothetical protein
MAHAGLHARPQSALCCDLARHPEEGEVVVTLGDPTGLPACGFPAALGHGETVKEVLPLTPAVLYELFSRHSQCILTQQDKCPHLLFPEQLCWELNLYFLGDRHEEACARGRMQYPRTGLAHEELE